ncbi:hypothetical protein ACPA9J_28060 [Pseudomonas aeruginosa]
MRASIPFRLVAPAARTMATPPPALVAAVRPDAQRLPPRRPRSRRGTTATCCSRRCSPAREQLYVAGWGGVSASRGGRRPPRC